MSDSYLGEMAEKHKRSEELSDMPDQEEIEFYNSRYFIINMTALRLVGLWPYQNKIEKFFLRTCVSLMIIVSIIPQIISAIVMKDNVERLIQAIGTMIYVSGIGIKYLGMIFTEKKLKNVYKSIVRNWRMLENENEKHILQESSEMGRMLTIGYIGYMVQAALVFVTLPLGHNILDVISPLANGTRTRLSILEEEYLVDRHKYYYHICLFESASVLGSAPLFSTIDSTYAVCIQQCVGLFNIVKLRLEQATKPKKKYKSNVFRLNDAAHDAIAKSVELHGKVLDFAQVLETSYSTSMLFVMIANVIILATASVNILFNLHSPLILFRFILIIVGLTIHMFYLSWPGQKMIDSSNEIFYAAYNNEWYQCSLESQKLLGFVMLRTIEPFYLTAGGFYIMNFENFESLFKTSVSYITVLASFNE